MESKGAGKAGPRGPLGQAGFVFGRGSRLDRRPSAGPGNFQSYLLPLQLQNRGAPYTLRPCQPAAEVLSVDFLVNAEDWVLAPIIRAWEGVRGWIFRFPSPSQVQRIAAKGILFPRPRFRGRPRRGLVIRGNANEFRTGSLIGLLRL